MYQPAVDVPESFNGVYVLNITFSFSAEKKRVPHQRIELRSASPSSAPPEEHVELFVANRTPAEDVQDAKMISDACTRISIALSKDAPEVIAKAHFVPASVVGTER